MATIRPQVHVLGAGVVGLSTAIRVQERLPNYEVVLIAETFPGDEKSIRYTSSWAGAHHVSLAGDDSRQSKMDRETFDRMWEMSAPGTGTAEKCFLRLPQTEYYIEDRTGYNCLEVMPDFKYVPKEDLLPDTKSGVHFTTLTIDTPVYLPYLLSLFLANGGRTRRSSVQHISQVIDGAYSAPSLSLSGPPAAIVVCVGLGARSLGGVEDQDVYPIRGQTVLVRTPWIKFGRTASSKDGLWTYIIPRRSGDVILGGVKVDNDWYPHPRPETTTDILERSLALCPELISSNLDKPATIETLQSLVIEEGCGLRPARKGGIRLEAEVVKSTDGKRSVPVVHNYGHGGYGYQSSWGSASMAVDLLEEALKAQKE